MKVYDAASISNVALVGHSGSGKTQLASAILSRRRHGQPIREGRRRDHRDRLRRRRDREKAHPVGQPGLCRVEQDENQPHRHAGHGQLPERRARRPARRRRRAGRRRRRRRRDGADRKSVGDRRASSRCRGWSCSTGWIATAPASSGRCSRCARRATAPSSRSSCRSAKRKHSKASSICLEEGVHVSDRRERQVHRRATSPPTWRPPSMRRAKR